MGIHQVFVCVCEREICRFKVVWYDLENASGFLSAVYKEYHAN